MTNSNLEATLVHALRLKAWIDSLVDASLDELELQFLKDGITIQGKPTEAAYISTRFDAREFEHYHVQRPHVVCVRSSALKLFLDKVPKDFSMTIETKDTDDDIHLQAYPSRATSMWISKYFRIRTIDAISDNRLNPPDTQHEATITCSSEQFVELMKQMATLSPNLLIRVHAASRSIDFVPLLDREDGNGVVTWKAASPHTTTQTAALDPDEDPTERVELECQDDVQITTRSHSLLWMTKLPSVLSTRVRLRFSPDIPLHIEHVLDRGLDSNHVVESRLDYYLAPVFDLPPLEPSIASSSTVSSASMHL